MCSHPVNANASMYVFRNGIGNKQENHEHVLSLMYNRFLGFSVDTLVKYI